MDISNLSTVTADHINRAKFLVATLGAENHTEIIAALLATIETQMSAAEQYKAHYERVVDEKADLDSECVSLALRLSDVGRQHKALIDLVVNFVTNLPEAVSTPVHHSNG